MSSGRKTTKSYRPWLYPLIGLGLDHRQQTLQCCGGASDTPHVALFPNLPGHECEECVEALSLLTAPRCLQPTPPSWYAICSLCQLSAEGGEDDFPNLTSKGAANDDVIYWLALDCRDSIVLWSRAYASPACSLSNAFVGRLAIERAWRVVEPKPSTHCPM
jgi:hypothetical protein